MRGFTYSAYDAFANASYGESLVLINGEQNQNHKQPKNKFIKRITVIWSFKFEFWMLNRVRMRRVRYGNFPARAISWARPVTCHGIFFFCSRTAYASQATRLYIVYCDAITANQIDDGKRIVDTDNDLRACASSVSGKLIPNRNL